jgi:threonylcarbamoyladenosine tRNA methylthiotransferase MtaB
MPLRVAFHTLGCKLNQLETESFAGAFARAGATVLPLDAEEGAADFVIVNTCTVTGKAEQKARRIVRRALADNPAAAALVTGCYAQVEAAALAALDERVLVLPGGGKEALLGLPGWLGSRGADGDLRGALREWLAIVAPASRVAAAKAAGAAEGSFAYEPEAFAFHSRPSLKIQDGCDNACAYCRVRIARGRSTSLAASEALARARALEAAGKTEIVLTGVNLSQYRDGAIDFPALLTLLVAGTERIAFRLSSYEPDRVDAAFLDAFADPRVRPHVHLAVQSGSDRILAAMGRRYGRADVAAAVEALRRCRSDPFVAADIISGFPGETEAEAASTLELAASCEFTWIHAFPFSPRPGTKAASMPNRVPERLAGERVKALLSLGRQGRSVYIDRRIGSEVQAILEGGREPVSATAENYLKLEIGGLPLGSRPGQAVLCRLEGRRGDPSAESIDAFARYIASPP